MEPNEQAVDVNAIAAMLGVTAETVYRKAKSSDIPGFKVGRLWRFFPSEVVEHLARPKDLWAYSSHSRAQHRRYGNVP